MRDILKLRAIGNRIQGKAGEERFPVRAVRDPARVPVLAACAAIWLALTGLPVGAVAGEEEDQLQQTPEAGEEQQPATLRPIQFQALPVPENPDEGQGRMTLRFEGNRRWCTTPDDRMVKPPETPRPASRPRKAGRSGVFTFGYQFTVAAIRRGQPTVPIMLYESPVIRTASMRSASKLERGGKLPVIGPGVGGGGIGPTAPRQASDPEGLLPYWEERYRCTTLDEIFEFDLSEGTYDIYAAFDLMNRRGGWSHRTFAFIEQVPIQSGRRTLVDGVLDYASPTQRRLEFRRADLEVGVALEPGKAP